MKIGYSLVLLLALSACGGTNPLNSASTSGSSTTGTSSTTTSTTGGNTGGISGATTLPPGTASPTTSGNIIRYEQKDTPDAGNGYATDISYNATNDTFTVNDLAFDGGNTYTRGKAVSSLGPFAVYEAASTYNDSITGTPINQFLYRAIYAVSASGKTQFAIVRTGAYVPYGFGGFLYQRNGSVTLPTSGQAHFAGSYAGLRDFNGQGGLQFTRGDMTMDVDFRDFINGPGVKGSVTNRHIYKTDGTDITNNVLAQIGTKFGIATPSALPQLNLVVSPNAVNTASGEIAGQVSSYVAQADGSAKQYESGNYYAVLAGNNASEVVGVIVVTNSDPAASTVTDRETGGFILVRQ